MKKAVYYTGLGGGVEPVLDRILDYFKYDLYQEDHDYYQYWIDDKGESFMRREIENAKDKSLVIGLSFGGYVAYHVAKANGIPCILINPALDRAKTRTGIYDFEMNYEPKDIKLEVYIATDDNVVPPRYTTNYLKKNSIECQIVKIDDMGHNCSYQHIFDILGNSKIVDIKK